MTSHARWIVPVVIALAIGAGGPGVLTQNAGAPPAPIDLQRVQDQDTMTWADYHPIPGVNWADPSLKPARAIRVALVAIDFEDQPFVITQPKGGDPFGNPQIDPIKRDDVATFYAGFLGTPGRLNHGHTINEYWMEQSRGRVGIPKIDAFGPYRMPKKLFQYGLNEYNQASACPSGYTCDGRMEPDADALWAAQAGADIKSKYDIVLRIYAGYDETTVWQEFGEMKFATKEDIPGRWGNPDPTKPRWVTTRYVPWTSWLAGAQQWGLSSVRQGESSGTITHEIAHHAFSIGDNNNNPYVAPYRRVGSGTWDMMDRGGFNGPGGPHRRWVVPVTEGASMPAGFLLRNRLVCKFAADTDILRLNRDGLAASGLAVANVIARSIDPGPNGVTGLVVSLDGPAPMDRSPRCDRNTDPLCSGEPTFSNYTVEVVQRIGYDSFTPDNGVLVAKNKDRQDNGCGYGCHSWVIDAHPEDMNMVDFTKPNGEKVMRTVADYRQLNDALFHAGLRSGSQFEWEDTANRLHFYVIDRQLDARGVLSYTIAVRSLDGAGPHTRGVTVGAPTGASIAGASASLSVQLTNTGTAAAVAPTTHPALRAETFANDVYRLTVSIEGQGWAADLRSELASAKFGATVGVPVAVRRAPNSAATARLTVTATSESDPTKTASAVVNLSGR